MPTLKTIAEIRDPGRGNGGSMAASSKHHKELNENGEGKCSVPMWRNGVPAGFCDEIAYGKTIPYETFRDNRGERKRFDGGYCGYVPYLACPGHGGPKHRLHKGDPCIYCGTPHDDVRAGPCPGH